jgi:hypothetical protein
MARRPLVRATGETMTFKRKALGAITRVELLEVGKALELDVTTGMRLDEMMDVDPTG